MKINSLNHEAYLLDYLEKRLSTEEIGLLKTFIELHPELGTWEMLTETFETLPQQDLVFENKELLYQPEINATGTISESNYEETFIAYHEQLLQENEQREVAEFLLKNVVLQKDFDLYGKTKIYPDTKIIFEQKDFLHQKPTTIALWYKSIAVAATIALLIGFGFLFQTKPHIDRQQLTMLPTLEMRKTASIKSTNKPPQMTLAIEKRLDIASLVPCFEEKADQNATAIEIPALKSITYQPIEWTDMAFIQYTQTTEKMYFYFDIHAFLAENGIPDKEKHPSFTSNLKEQIHIVSRQIIQAKTFTEEQILNGNSDNLIKEIAYLSNSLFSVFNNKDSEE